MSEQELGPEAYERRFRDIVEAFDEMTVYDVDAYETDVSCAPPYDQSYVESFEEKLGHPLPEEFVQFAKVTSGVGDIWMDGRFSPSLSLETHRGLERLGRCCTDGFGNDLYLQYGESRCPVWFLPHDPPHTILMARSLLDFLEMSLEHTRRYKEANDQYREIVEHDAWERESEIDRPPEPLYQEYETIDSRPVTEIEETPDVDLFSRVAERFPEAAEVADLRSHDAPVGFSRYGLESVFEWRAFGEVFVGLPEEKVAEVRRDRERHFEEERARVERRLAERRRKERLEHVLFDGGDDEPIEFSPWWKFW
jgi:hypothetical protein